METYIWLVRKNNLMSSTKSLDLFLMRNSTAKNITQRHRHTKGLCGRVGVVKFEAGGSDANWSLWGSGWASETSIQLEAPI